MTDLPHVASRIFGTPLLVARPKLEVILGVLGPRLAGRQAALPVEDEPAAVPAAHRTPEGIAIVPVIGTLVNRSSWVAAASGLTAYSEIADSIEAAATDPAVRGILLELDSPGGEVGGLFDLVDWIGAVRTETGKPVWAVASEGALSAAYAIASATDRIYVTQTGEIGSIGVVAVHVDESGADRQAGLAWSFIHAGARKVDGNPHQPLSDRARADLQADVDGIYDRLVALVAGNRRLSPEAVRATDAAIYRGDKGVAAGLADRVGTLDRALADMTAQLARPPAVSLPRSRAPFSHSPPKELSMNDDHSAGVADPVPVPDNPAVTAAVPKSAAAEPALPAASVEQRLRAEYAEIAAISAQAARLGVSIDLSEAMAKGIRPDALRRSVLDELAARAEATAVVSAAPRAAAAGDSPIVRRARERAADAAKTRP